MKRTPSVRFVRSSEIIRFEREIHVCEHAESFYAGSSFVKMEKQNHYRKDREFAELVARRLRQLRYEHGYTQENVVDKTHLDIHRYEAGTTIPLLSSIVKLCRFYGITLDEFFAPMNYPPRP